MARPAITFGHEEGVLPRFRSAHEMAAYTLRVRSQPSRRGAVRFSRDRANLRVWTPHLWSANETAIPKSDKHEKRRTFRKHAPWPGFFDDVSPTFNKLMQNQYIT
jgi:hypothetical protein